MTWKRRYAGRLVAWCALAMNLHPDPAGAQGRHEFRELHLGMEVRIVVHARTDMAARDAARAAYSRAAELEDILSDWRPASEVRQLARRPGEWIVVSPVLFDVLARALDIARRTGGTFDPTVGPLTMLWRDWYRAGLVPPDSLLARARASSGWHRVALDSTRRAVRLDAGGMRIDLGGIAKGWILQSMSAVLDSAGCPQHLIEAGGDIVVGDAPNGIAGWQVDALTAGRDTTVVVVRGAIATSGSSVQYREIAGRRYSHLIDPRTGLGVPGVTQVTVVARDGATADAAATALAIGGPGLLKRMRLPAGTIVLWSEARYGEP